PYTGTVATPVIRPAPPAAKSRPRVADWAALTEVDPGKVVKVERSQHSWPMLLVLAGVLLGTALFLGVAVVIHVTTDNGELVIETEDPSIQVVVKQGGKVVTVIDPKTNQRVKLSTGTYDMALNKDAKNVQLVPNAVVLKRGEQEVVRVKRIPPPPAKPRPITPAPVPESVGEIRRFEGAHPGGATYMDFSPHAQKP